ncbi:Malto-oligosyltrehalose trehalohydrolase [Rhodovastum atsumiense]|uniref:Malto-oligosyltrehalose trehalohydrolase n=1 Tax=Rhodovastum atsumiense TaxID=504468 RepID=A0A5M6IQJ1_9PROT|nr:malto-oligosyltrehalose trehalohydrolase [Rhodovastum atsumiense]KAA5610540.1 malto-oligosyltrehalose trehalohydrolase [Rhodovastum atsumiense]CAH2605010.1 Malto-oligosyltrehalose trehalohydrolase [Rhodovastum atsumiense]
MTRHAHRLPFGAELQADGGTLFRLWAPDAKSVVVEVDGAAPLTMTRRSGGWHEARAECGAGARYRYRLPGGRAVPDPASRLQDGDVHGRSVVLDPRAHDWRHPSPGRPWHEAVIYEVHVGLAGGFMALADRLEGLRDIGFTAIELMPVADFPGRRNWGYDGVLPFAPATAYGSPGELKTLVDRAHGLGLMVLLDVVYNHFGPDGNYLHGYAGAFFTKGKHTPWGAAIDFHRPEVRDFFIQNALYWLNEYRFDGLRFDAVHAISPQAVLPEFARTIRAGVEPGRPVHLVLEHGDNRAGLLAGGARFDGQWADDFHHCVHRLLTGESEGYYGDFDDPAARLARCLAEGFAWQGETTARGRRRGEPSADLPTTAFVICLQNHDQIGNRAMGERLTLLADPEALCAAAALLLLTPQIPLVFMGEECGSRTPFLYFTDHPPELARRVREGRRREFAHFAAFADAGRRDRIPDPNAPETFLLSRPDPTDAEPRMAALYHLLLDLRRRHLMARIPGCRSLGAGPVGETGVLARWGMGDGTELVIACNLGPAPLLVDAMDGPMLFESRAGAAEAVRHGHLPASCTVAFLLA